MRDCEMAITGHTNAAQRIGAALMAVTAALGGCASGRHDKAPERFSANAPFSKTISGSGDSVCWPPILTATSASFATLPRSAWTCWTSSKRNSA